MKFDGGEQRWRATDLSDFSACRHKTTLEREHAYGGLKRPGRADPAMKLLQDRGIEHEARYLALLQSRHGQPAVRVPGAPPKTLEEWSSATARTLEAMQAGHRVIYQAPLAHGPWSGIADFLVRRDHTEGAPPSKPSKLGAYHYEVVDTKLAQEAKASAILQLCVYTQMVAELQAYMPEHLYVASPSGATLMGQTPEPREQPFRTADYLAYFAVLRQRFEAFAKATEAQAPYPEPVEHCDVCAWWERCDKRRRDDDHLSLVAGMAHSHQRLLQDAGVNTLSDLAKVQLPLAQRPKKLPAQTFERLAHQARLQFEAREAPARFELLEVEPGLGLCRLPEPSAGDVFFDIEADRYVPDGTFHYLLGWSLREADGSLRYQGLWATTREEERQNLERFFTFVLERRLQFPDMHVYHFAPFEKTALGEMTGRFAAREDEWDEILRNEVFVDLMPVVKQSLRAGIESYSIKELERFYGFVRQTDLREASRARRLFELAREVGGLQDLSDVVPTVENYNREDCDSTAHLQTWLEEQRARLCAEGQQIPRPELKQEAPREDLSEWIQRVEALRSRLTHGVPADTSAPTEGERARLLLADLIDWHRREAKPGWWEHFRVRALSEEELLDDSATIGGLGPEVATGTKIKRSLVFEYSFPEQEFSIKTGDQVECPLTEQDVGEVVEVRRRDGVIVVKRTKELSTAPRALVATNDSPKPKALQEALAEIADALAPDFGLASIEPPSAPFQAARALLRRSPPHLANNSPLSRPHELPGEALNRVAPHLRGSVLAVQGPPGAGKTHNGSAMIVELVRAGKKVGITATSHQVIENLLESVHEAAERRGVSLFSMQKPKGGSEPMAHPRNAPGKSSAEIRKLLDQGEVNVVAGTAWLWCDVQLRQSVDVLVVDEAGQFPLANALAVSVAADSLVLLGDPQQLAQPSAGAHPPGAGASALEHLLDGHETVPANMGLFLAETWRLPPKVTEFTSRYFYAGRLRSQAQCAGQRLNAPGSPFDGAGLFIEPIEHRGNVNNSDEEALRITQIVRDLLASKATWTDREGHEQALTLDDILIMAPYNLQVHHISQTLSSAGFPDARVGSVDRFQGQEAPVVFYSMTTSTPEDAPRGFDFLYSLNRLNVATSRTQAVMIVVASPRLLEAECKTPKQMRLINGLCGVAEASNPQNAQTTR